MKSLGRVPRIEVEGTGSTSFSRRSGINLREDRYALEREAPRVLPQQSHPDKKHSLWKCP